MDKIEERIGSYHCARRLLFDHGAVPAANFTPTAVQPFPVALFGPKGSARGRLFIDLDPPTRLFAGPQVTILHDRTALKNLPRAFVERRVFLDAEIVADQVEHDVRHVPDGRNVA